MIVFSDALVAAKGPAYTFNLPVVHYDNLVTAANITADFEDSDYPVTNAANPQTRSVYKSGSTSDGNVTVTLPGTDLVDSVGIARHNLGSSVCTFSIWGITADPGAVYEELIPDTLLGDDTPALFLFEEGYLVGLQIRFSPDAVAPQMAVLYVGKSLMLLRSVKPGHRPITYARSRDVLQGRSQSGEYLGTIITQERLSTPVEITLLDPVWYFANMQPFIDVCHEPFFFAWRPDQYPDQVGYAWATNDPQPSIGQFTGEVDISLELSAVAL